MTFKHRSPIVLLVVAALLVIFGPAWPRAMIGPQCSEGAGAFQLACFWIVERVVPVWNAVLGPLWYWVVLPALIVIAVWMLSKGTGRAMAVALGMTALVMWIGPLLAVPLELSGLSVPSRFQNLVWVWPQRVFFILYKSGERGGPLVPWEWANVFTGGFWITAALVFGLLARRVKPMLALFPLATTFVVAVVLLVGRIVPMLGYRIRVELP